MTKSIKDVSMGALLLFLLFTTFLPFMHDGFYTIFGDLGSCCWVVAHLIAFMVIGNTK